MRLPRHQVAMLRHFAERDYTTVSTVLPRELDGVASVHAPELSWTVAGFADALALAGRRGHAAPVLMPAGSTRSS